MSRWQSAFSAAQPVAITFSSSGTITLASTLSVPAGDGVSVDSTGEHVVIDGGGATSLISDSGSLSLSSLTLQNGLLPVSSALRESAERQRSAMFSQLAPTYRYLTLTR